MAQAGFAYGDAREEAIGRLPLSVAIFADRAHLREQMREDAMVAGLRVGRCAELSVLLESEAIPLGEVVVIDCPRVDGGTLAALSRLDMRAARSSARLVVSTSTAALDDVFACLDQSSPQILVDPTRAERIVALGRVLGELSGLRLREMSEEDRLTLLRLAEQVERIAQHLGAVGPLDGAGGALPEEADLQLESPVPAFVADGESGGDRLYRGVRPPLPDPRLVRRIIRQRQLRARFFDSALFADPAWDMLLDLTAARAEHVRVSVTSLCIASGVPATTALRWIAQMTEAGLLERLEDVTDRRRAFIALTDRAADAMARYFAEMGRAGADLV